jgi:hypothetical protein
MKWRKVRINCLEWSTPDSPDEYYEYRTTAKEGWQRLVVVEKGLRCWWWVVFDGNFFPYKIGCCAERKYAFEEATGHLVVLEARDHLPEEATTVVTKGVNGEWHYEGKPAHQVVMPKFLEGLKPGVLLRVIPSKDSVTKKVKRTRREPCPDCKGTGFVDGKCCRRCEGGMSIPKTKRG